jgi:predicted transcriptional regulator YdeE
MNPKIIPLDQMAIIGIDSRTTNEKEMNGVGVIPTLWQRFMGENLNDTIPNKVEHSPIVCIYTDYENGVVGQYMVLLGSQVTRIDEIPRDMAARTIPQGKYAVFTTEKGPVGKVVQAAWAFIWDWFQNSKLERAYTVDFELYDERSLNPDKAQVDIYIAIK